MIGQLSLKGFLLCVYVDSVMPPFIPLQFSCKISTYLYHLLAIMIIIIIRVKNIVYKVYAWIKELHYVSSSCYKSKATLPSTQSIVNNLVGKNSIKSFSLELLLKKEAWYNKHQGKLLVSWCLACCYFLHCESVIHWSTHAGSVIYIDFEINWIEINVINLLISPPSPIRKCLHLATG